MAKKYKIGNKGTTAEQGPSNIWIIRLSNGEVFYVSLETIIDLYSISNGEADEELSEPDVCCEGCDHRSTPLGTLCMNPKKNGLNLEKVCHLYRSTVVEPQQTCNKLALECAHRLPCDKCGLEYG